MVGFDGTDKLVYYAWNERSTAIHIVSFLYPTPDVGFFNPSTAFELNRLTLKARITKILLPK